MADSGLEYPPPEGNPDWAGLYRSRGDDVNQARPVFTGDVFLGVEVQDIGQINIKDVIILQHPCALRMNGVELLPRLVVAEVRANVVISQREWTKRFKVMPLPELRPGNATEHYAAFFGEPYLIDGKSIDVGKRVACMSQRGVNLLLQRWVFHNSRSAVPTWKYDEVTSPEYEEADLAEEWCDDRVTESMSIGDAAAEFHAWLREPSGQGGRWQDLLENAQARSAVRKGMRDKLRRLTREND